MNPRNRQITNLAVIILVMVFILLAWMLRFHNSMIDFNVFRTAGARFVSGEPLYQLSDGEYSFKYLPFSAIWFIDVSLLPLGLAEVLMLVLIVISVVFQFEVASGMLDLNGSGKAWITGITAILLLKFLGRELELGQVNAVLGAVLLGSVLAMMAGKRLYAGLLLAMAISLKPYALIFVPWLILRRDWRVLGWTFAGLAFLSLVVVLRFGFAETLAMHRDWWTVIQSTNAKQLINPDNISLFGLIAKWRIATGSMVVMRIGIIVCAVLFFGIFAVLGVRRKEFESINDDIIIHETALLMLLMPLFSPQGWDYGLIGAVLPMMMVVSAFRYLPLWLKWLSSAAMVVMGLSYYDLMGAVLYHTFMMSNAITIAVLVLIGVLLLGIRTKAHQVSLESARGNGVSERI